MASVYHEYESEALSEFEGESEWEDESEGEAFYSKIARLARRAPDSPALMSVARKAARAALGAMKATCDGESECEAELEGEWEDEAEGEFEAGLNPIRRVYPDALMEHLGHAAAATESEAEAEAFIGALVPLAAKVLPRVARAVMKAAPSLVKGVSRVAKALRGNPATRQLVRAMPELTRRTVRSLAHRAAHHKPVTGRAALKSLAHHASHLLRHPKQVVRTYRRSRALDHHLHRVGSRHHNAGIGHGPHHARHRAGQAWRYHPQARYPKGHAWRYHPWGHGRRTGVGAGTYGAPGWKYWARLGTGQVPAGGALPTPTSAPGVSRRYGPWATTARRRRHAHAGGCGCCCCGGCGCGR